MKSFEDSILRVLKGDSVVGAAFLVSDRLVATCAHVVESAGAEVGGKISLRSSSGKNIDAIVEPEFWRDPNAEDISILRLNRPLENIQPVILGSSSGTKGHTFSTFGFPRQGQELSGGGEIIGQATINGIKVLQLRSPEVTPGFSGAPVFDETTKRVVGMVVAITPPDEYQRLGTTAFAIPSETVRAIGTELQVSDICPYRSLDVFNEEDAPFFFGRERVVQKMIDNLKREPRFLAVFGPSGSGKSSVVRAGLIPALKNGKILGSDKWGAITIRPSNQPFEQLDNGGLSNSQDSLEEAAHAWLGNHSEKTRLVLVIDQFEELLVSTTEDIRQKFTKDLANLLGSSVAITVILTLRDDFYSRFLQDASVLTSWLERGLVNIPTTLDQDQLHAIIHEPAKLLGLTFEEGLVDDIISDAVEADRATQDARSTILPLLEFALTQVWEKRQGARLSHDSYHAIGGVTGGLAQWADRAYYALNLNEQKLAKEIFGKLIRLGDEAEQIPDTRRTRLINELDVREKQSELEMVVNKLIQARLFSTQRDIRTGLESIEIIHEALLREWGLLKIWLNEFRNHEKILQEKNRRRITIGLATGLIIMMVISFFAAWQWNLASKQTMIANEKANEALARQLAAESKIVYSSRLGGPVVSTLLAIESLKRYPSIEGTQALSQATSALAKIEFVIPRSAQYVSFNPNHQLIGLGWNNAGIWNLETGNQELQSTLNEDIYYIVFSPTKDVVALVSYDNHISVKNYVTNTEIFHIDSAYEINDLQFSDRGNLLMYSSILEVVVWDILNQHILLTFHLGENENLGSAVISPDGKLLGVYTYNSYQIVDIDTGEVLFRVSDNSSQHYVILPFTIQKRLVFSPDSKHIALCTNDNLLEVWDTESQSRVVQITDPSIVFLGFTHDGKNVIAGSDFDIRFFDATTGEATLYISTDGYPSTFAESPDGLWFATGSGWGTTQVWDRNNGEEIVRLRSDETYDSIRAVTFSRDSRKVISVSDYDIKIIDAFSLTEYVRLLPSIRVYELGFSKDGTKIAFGGGGRYLRDNKVGFWDMKSGFPPNYYQVDGDLMSMALSPNGKFLAFSNYESLQIWNTEIGQKVKNISLQNGSDITFSPDGKMLLFRDKDKINVWNMETLNLDFVIRVEQLNCLYLSLDGKLIVSGDEHGKVRVWDAFTGNELFHLDHQDSVRAITINAAGNFLASGNDDSNIHIWDLKTRRQVSVINGGYAGFVRTMKFSDDGTKIISVGLSDVAVWDTRTGNEISHITHDNGIQAADLSPDGLWAFSADSDGEMKVWNADMGLEIERIHHDYDSKDALGNAILSISISPDGKWVVSGGSDGTLRFWRWQIDDLIDSACNYVTRNLGREEWKQYFGDEPYHATCPHLPLEPEATATPIP